jgi:S-(hydroxymethyl)glutathione dehydrogenase / alcohol dehydrogenase
VKAAVLRTVGAPISIEEIALEPPRANEVRVRIGAAGICHSDYHFVTGDLSTPLPAVLGHEGAGVVEEVGKDVTSVAPGDHVLFLWRTSCGRCALCQTGRPALCTTGLRARSSGLLEEGSSRLSRGDERIHHVLGISCFAEQAVTSERSVLKIPATVPMEIAALIGCAVMTGVGAVVNTAALRAGSSVLVIGAGGVGQCVVMAARLAGASTIVVADISTTKLAAATALGATHVVDTSSEDLVKAVRARTDGGVDYAFEVVGRPDTLGQAVRALRAGGTAVAVGLGKGDARVEVGINDLVLQEKTLKGSLYGSARPAADVPMLIDLWASGRLPLDQLVSRHYPLAKVNEAYAAMLAGEVARSVITFAG